MDNRLQLTEHSALPPAVRKKLNSNGWKEKTVSKKAVWVDVKQQKVFLIEKDCVLKIYNCSTGRAGTGNIINSNKTPLGWHVIEKKIGEGLQNNAVLKDRKWTGEIWHEGLYKNRDLILSRIMWLKGTEEGKNSGGSVDTFQRYIYIHGTNQVGKLGKPASHGCIRMDPVEIIELYDTVSVKCPVLITDD